MNADSLRRKLMAEFLEKIKDWPEDAKRSMKEAFDRMLAKPKPKEPKKLTSDDAFGSWVGPESAEEIIDMIYSSRTQNPDRLPL